jgi:hypothetical protein
MGNKDKEKYRQVLTIGSSSISTELSPHRDNRGVTREQGSWGTTAGANCTKSRGLPTRHIGLKVVNLLSENRSNQHGGSSYPSSIEISGKLIIEKSLPTVVEPKPKDVAPIFFSSPCHHDPSENASMHDTISQ